MFLKRRFLKDQRFFDDYKKFMDNFHVKDYAKHSEVGISHIMAYTNQVSQARLGWYSTAVLTFKENPSIEIIGTMKRFREKKIAFMADIEAMYHQVFVPDDQHTFLKFLWWTTLMMSLKIS